MDTIELREKNCYLNDSKELWNCTVLFIELTFFHTYVDVALFKGNYVYVALQKALKGRQVCEKQTVLKRGLTYLLTMMKH